MNSTKLSMAASTRAHQSCSPTRLSEICGMFQDLVREPLLEGRQQVLLGLEVQIEGALCDPGRCR
jgi:hypothetical protein